MNSDEFRSNVRILDRATVLRDTAMIAFHLEGGVTVLVERSEEIGGVRVSIAGGKQIVVRPGGVGTVYITGE